MIDSFWGVNFFCSASWNVLRKIGSVADHEQIILTNIGRELFAINFMHPFNSLKLNYITSLEFL